MSNLQELNLILHFRWFSPQTALQHHFRELPTIKLLSKLRGVKLTYDISDLFSGEGAWLEAYMAQPKDAEGTTAHEGMATVDDVQAGH
jgi:hypothetical protein